MAIEPLASQLPIRVVPWNPTAGAVIDPADPALISSAGEIVSAAAGWTVPAAGFSNPKYLAADNADSTGWATIPGGSVVVAWEGTYTGNTVVYEQTQDPTGAAGWFAINGENISLTTGSISSSSTTQAAFVFAAIGQRMRVRVTALSTGTMVARVSNLSVPANFHFASIEAHGLVNHDSAVGGAPVQIAGQARDFGTPYSAVSADDVARFVTDLTGNLKVTQEFSWANIATATTTQVKSGAGVLHSINVNKGVAASTISIYNATSGTSNPIAIIDSALANNYIFDLAFSTGLRMVTSGATDVTVTYR